MKVTEIWRYPVKTMAGEKLQRARLGSLGIEGDRIVHVEDARGRVITSRSHPRFLLRGGRRRQAWQFGDAVEKMMLKGKEFWRPDHERLRREGDAVVMKWRS